MKESSNSKYEDNILFCSYRYNDSTLATEDFLSTFSSGFDELIFYPLCGSVLNHYYGYTKAIGIDTSYMSKKDW